MNRGWVNVDNPAKFPDVGEIESIEEPWVRLGVVTPDRYIGALMELTTGRRGTFENMEYLDPQRVHMHFELPLAELIVDYYDQLKSRTQGYASMDYEEIGYREANLVKLDVLVNGEPVDALTLIVHRDRAQLTGRQLADEAQASSSRARCSRCRSRPRSAATSSPARPSPRCARTSSRSATVATSPASASSSRSRRKESSG